MKKRFLALLLFCVMLLPVLAGCSEGDYGAMAPGDVAGMKGESGASDGSSNSENAPATIPAGQMTAAEWNDAEHFDLWLKMFQTGQDVSERGPFVSYVNEYSLWNLPYNDMLAVFVGREDVPVSGAKLTLKGDEGELYSAVSDAKGMAYLFYSDAAHTLSVQSGEETQDIALAEATLTDGILKVNVSDWAEKQNVIELMFLIDTTGSMGDELRYIKAEVDDVIARVKETNPGVTVRLALLFYRDEGDEYVTRYSDFTEDIEAQRAFLAQQKPDGGGDTPEAVHIALTEAVAQQWSTGNTTKLIFHILDAPPHERYADAQIYRQAILDAAEKGIRIIPVASSGIDKEAEYLLRSEALLTGGTYTFLTDDSGIGNSHLTPEVGTFTVEFLNSMLVRLISEFHQGIDISPVDWRQEVK